MDSATTRQQKINKQLQKDLADIFQQQGMQAYNGAMISVTGVRITPDLSIAKVYLSIFPSAKAEEVMDIVNENNKSIRGDLGRRVRHQLRIIPELVFYIDDSLDYAERIDNLLKQ
ncbi:MAG: 30S ribosome-binding factor RbfA [Prevotellaceae bacterium]|jgi:ribosome-binding factor A|nr:30S ribosome-binding factor RbfA [Prevotellaceae bacterium]